MPTIQIDPEANALVLQEISKEKQAATLQGKPTKRISKNKLVSDLIKSNLRKPRRTHSTPPPVSQKG